MKTFLFVLAISLSLGAFAQKQIKLEEVKDHVGDSVKVSGTIYGIKVFEDDDKKPTLALINLGADYPNQWLTLAVHPEAYKNSSAVFPDQRFKGGVATVTGKIELYKGKFQIAVHSPELLVLATADSKQ